MADMLSTGVSGLLAFQRAAKADHVDIFHRDHAADGEKKDQRQCTELDKFANGHAQIPANGSRSVHYRIGMHSAGRLVNYLQGTGEARRVSLRA